MRFPSKLTPVAESVFHDACLLLAYIKRNGHDLTDLYRWSSHHGWTLHKLMQILELLYAIGHIDLVDDQEICYVG